MRVWVTGCAGFLGSHLIDALIAEGHEVCGNDSLVCGDVENIPQGICWKGVDCRDFEGMLKQFNKFKPEVVVHAAATAHEGVSSFSPSFISKNIFEASIATFSAAIASGVQRIVYMTSMARYGDQRPPFTEDMPTKPVDVYGIAKVAAEECLKNLAATHGIKYSILVPHNILGIRQKYDDPGRNVSSIMINRSLKKEPLIIYGDGEQTRCFSPVQDCIPSIIRAVYGDGDGEVINIGPDKGEISINMLANMIDDITKNPWSPLHYADRPNEAKHAFTSSDKARQLLGYEEQRTVEETLKEMVEDIKARGTKEFNYFFPLEIVNERTPKTWLDKLI